MAKKGKSHGKAKSKSKGARRSGAPSRVRKRSSGGKKASPRLRKPSAKSRAPSRKPSRPAKRPKKSAPQRRRVRARKPKRGGLKRNPQGGLREFQGRVFGKARFGSWRELLDKVGEKLRFYYPEIGDRLEPDEEDEGDNE
jgi:hypothetical protein